VIEYPVDQTYLTKRYTEKAIREGDWKMLVNKTGAQLFNLRDDPSETNDLANVNQSILDALMKKHAVWLKDMPPRKDQNKPPIIQPKAPAPLTPVLKLNR